MRDRAYATQTLSEDYPDEALLQRAQTGDLAAFELLIARYRSLLLHTTQKILKDPWQAQDTVQQVSLRFYLSLATIKPEVPLQRWLVKVAYHCCIDVLRRPQYRQYVSLDALVEEERLFCSETLIDPEPLPEDVAEHKERWCMLNQAINELPARARAIVLLHIQEHLTFKEVGQRLRISESTTKATFYRVLKRLRCQLELEYSNLQPVCS